MTNLPMTVALTVSSVLFGGCVTNATLGRTFREEMDQCVDKVFMDSASWGCRWADAIAKRSVSATVDEYDIAPDFMGKCRWTYVVDRNTRRVIAWRYAGGEQDCYIRLDWLGPW